MTSGGLILVIITFVVLAVGLTVFSLIMIKLKRKKKVRHNIEVLETSKNSIISSNILTELNKVGSLVNNKKLEERYNSWQSRFKDIKETEVPKLTDMLLEVENTLEDNDFRTAVEKLTEAELEIFYVKAKANKLLDDIRDITLSEERNRGAVTKLKSTYRGLVTKFNKNKLDYKDIIKPIELQFENIDKLFSAFEVAMEKNEYDEVGKIVRGLDEYVNNMAVVIEETPTVITLGRTLLPKKINDIKAIAKRMKKNGFNIDYLNIEYNIEEAEKTLSEVFDRLNVLNLEDSIFELKTLLDYFESLYADFDKEKVSKKSYEEALKIIGDKVGRLSKIIKNIYAELNDLKSTYDLSDEELMIIDEINLEIREIKSNFKNVNDRTKSKILPFSKLAKECELISVKLYNTEDKLENTLRTLGSLKDDELRAREQLAEIRDILNNAKHKIKEYKLCIVPKSYFIELKEASEAIAEIVRELERKPISIRTLNTRVDTARDLVLKLYTTSKELVKTAAMAEMAIVYANRYRSSYKDIENGLIKSEKEFFKGDYRNALETILNALNLVEPGIHKKLLNSYK